MGYKIVYTYMKAIEYITHDISTALTNVPIYIFIYLVINSFIYLLIITIHELLCAGNTFK